jgi:hypothetical protein
MCAEELMDEDALIRVKRVLMDMNVVPYIPGLFSVRSIRLLLRANSIVLPLLTENLLQGLIELYRSYPPQPDIPRPDHLLPSAAVEAKRARAAEALPGSETTESESPLVDNSPGPSLELTSRRVVGLCANGKRKKLSLPGMNMLPC